MSKVRAADLRRPLRASLRDQREQARKTATSSRFALSGMSVTADNEVTVDGDLIVLGDFTADGKITNTALVSPVLPAQSFQGRNTFGLTVAGAYILTSTVTVPTGYTKCIVQAFGRIAAINSTGSPDALYSSLDVNGVGGNQFGVPVAASGGFNTTTAGYGTLRTGLVAGGTLAVGLYGSTSGATWASNAANGADLAVTFLWMR